MAISEERKKEMKENIKQGRKKIEGLKAFADMLAELTQDDSLFIVKESLELRNKDDLLTTSLTDKTFNSEELKRIRTFYENINKLFDDIMREMNVNEQSI